VADKQQLLCDAVINGDLRKVVALTRPSWFSKGLDVNLGDHRGITPIFLAAKSGNLEMLRLLLSVGADVNSRDAAGETPLFEAVRKGDNVAAKSGNLEMLRLLLSVGADVNSKDAAGETPLFEAVRKGDNVIAQTLIKHGAAVNVVNNEGGTPLSLAEHETLRELLQENGALDILGAARSGKEEFVKEYVKKNARIEAVDRGGNTPLILSIEHRHEETALTLIWNCFTSINAVNIRGEDALMLAAKNGLGRTVELLINKGADVKRINERGEDALMLAAKNGLRKVAQLLVDKGARVNRVNKNGENALSMAAQLGHKDVIQLLVAKGAHVWELTTGQEDVPCLRRWLCKFCDKTREEYEHVWELTAGQEDAPCLRRWLCKFCDKTREEYEHMWELPTGQEDVPCLRRWSCKLCGKTKEEDIETEHVFEFSHTENATRGRDHQGRDTISKCRNCGKTKSEYSWEYTDW